MRHPCRACVRLLSRFTSPLPRNLTHDGEHVMIENLHNMALIGMQLAFEICPALFA